MMMQVTGMLGTMLTKEELEEFMKEADVVRKKIFSKKYYKVTEIIKGWQRKAWLWWICENATVVARRQILIVV